MRLNIFLRIMVILFFIPIVKGQDTMYVHRNNGGILKVPIANIDSIVFYADIPTSDSVVDIDGNKYATINIGNQIWMKENLKVKHAPDGSPITSHAYNDDESNAEIYGRLYSWEVIMNGSAEEKEQGICPDGWHVPSDSEYKTLEMYYGMTQEEADMINGWRGSGAGTKFKLDDSTGYNAKLSGRRNSTGSYSLKDAYEYMWTSTEYGADYAWRRCLSSSSSEVGRWNTFPKTYGLSLRCIKDE